MRANGTARTRRLLLAGAMAATAAMPARPPGDALLAAAPSRHLPRMVTIDTVKAIDKGLQYLARTQRPDGCWFNSGGYGGYNYPAVMTSLAGIACLASGSTPESGPYSRQVKRAMLYVLRLAESSSDGLICGPTGEARSMYGHGFSMLFLAQCYGVELEREFEKRIRNVLDKAVKLTARAQSDAGGWIYTPAQRSDEGSVTVTQLQALRACRNVGIKVPRKTIDQAVAYLRYCQNADGGISYSARSRGGSRPAISAAAIACFYAAGIYDRQRGGGAEAKMVHRLVDYCRRAVSVHRGGGHYFYTHFYYAQGLYQRGGEGWENYYPKIRDRLTKTQSVDGSWMGDSVGTTYGTAIGTIILQLPYGYLPVCQR